MTGELLAKDSVVDAMTIDSVADDRVMQMFEMPSQLMSSARVRLEFDQRIPALGKTAGGVGESGLSEGSKVGSRLLNQVRSFQVTKGIIDPLIADEATNDSMIGFLDHTVFKEFSIVRGGRTGLREQKDARGRAIEPVDGMQAKTSLLLQKIDESGLAHRGGFAFVNEDTRGFVHHEKIFVLVYQRITHPTAFTDNARRLISSPADPSPHRNR